MAVLSTPVKSAFVKLDPTVAFLVACIAVVIYFFKQHTDYEKRRGGAKQLPGPKGVPFIGNLRQLPAQKPWVALKQWGDEFGEYNAGFTPDLSEILLYPIVAKLIWGPALLHPNFTGPLYRLKLGVQEVVVVSSADHAIELLDRRSPKYSSRPRQVMANDLISRGLRLTFMP
jgi:hypothetical protein